MANEYIDIAGRLIEATKDLTEVIREGMNSAVETVSEFSDRDTARNSTLEDIKELLGQLNALPADVAEIKKIAQESIQMHRDRQQGNLIPENQPTSDQPTFVEKSSQILEKNITEKGGNPDQTPTEKLSREMEIDMKGKPLEVWVAGGVMDTKVIKAPETKSERFIGDETIMGSIPKGGAATTHEDLSRATTPPGGGGGGGGRGRRAAGGLTQTGQKQVLRTAGNVASGLLGFISTMTGGMALSDMVKGIVSEEVDYNKIMSQLGLQLHGLNDESGILRDNFKSAGDRLETVAQTGQKLEHWMMGMVKAQKRGLKNQEYNNKMVKSALNMSTQTGIEAQTANEIYADWGQHFHLSNMELTTMTYTLRDISRQTGLAGENLQEAVKSSEALQRKLRGAGVATRKLIGQAVKLSALAQVQGISDSFGVYADALTGGFGKFAELPAEIQGSLMRFARGDRKLMDDVMAGRGMEQKNLKKLAKGMQLDTQEMLGIDLMNVDLSKIDSTRMKSLQIMSEKIYGQSIGDLQKFLKVVHEGSLSLDDRIKKATNDLSTERNKLKDQLNKGIINKTQYDNMIAAAENRNKTLIKDLNLTGISNSLTDVFKAGEEGVSSFNEALQEAGGKGGIQAGMTKITDGFATMAQDAQEKLDKQLAAKTITQTAYDAATSKFDVASVSSQFEKAIQSGDVDKAKALYEQLNKFQETADAQSMMGTSTQSKTENLINQTNAILRQSISDPLLKFLDFLGPKIIIWTGLLLTAVTALSSIAVLLVTTFGASFLGSLTAGITGGVTRGLGSLMGLIGGLRGPMPAGGIPGGGMGGGMGGMGNAMPTGGPAGPGGAPYMGMPSAAGQQAHHTANTGPKKQTFVQRQAQKVKRTTKRYTAKPRRFIRNKFTRRGGSRKARLIGGVLGFLGRNKEAVAGTALGAGAGYYASDGDLGATLGGAAAGGAAGHFGSKWWKNRKAGAAANMAGEAADMGMGMGGMGGMPAGGYGNVVPVYVVNMPGGGMGGFMPPMGGMGPRGGMGGLGSTVAMAGAGYGAGELLDTGFMALEGVDLAQDATDVAKATKAAATSTVNYVRGGSKAAETAAKGSKAVTEVSKTSKILSGAAQKFGSVAKFGAKAMKAVPLLGAALEAGLGAYNAEAYGNTKTEGAIYGLLTGGNQTGSMFSEAFGIEQGSNADEAMGVAGAAAQGAILGATVGGPVGAAIGSVAGAATEIYKITANANKEVDAMAQRLERGAAFQEGFNEKSLEATQSIADPAERLKELERKLEGKLNLAQGQEKNLERSLKERSGMTNWFGINPAARAQDATIKSDEKQLNLTKTAIDALRKEIESEKSLLDEQKRNIGVSPLDTFEPSDLQREQKLGEVAPIDSEKEGAEIRTMSFEEGAEARIAREKVQNQLQEVRAYTDTKSLEDIGTTQNATLSDIKNEISKLISVFNTPNRGMPEKVGGYNGVPIGDPSTRYTGNAAALDFGASPYSSANEPGMQQVVSQGGVGE